MYEAFFGVWGVAFVLWSRSVTKQILDGLFGKNCLILPHDPHVFRFTPPWLSDNGQKHEAYEDV